MLNYSLKSNPFYERDFDKNNNNNWKQSKFSQNIHFKIFKFQIENSTYFTYHFYLNALPRLRVVQRKSSTILRGQFKFRNWNQ